MQLIGLGWPSRISSDVVRAGVELQLSSSYRDSAKLNWQHRLHGLPADKLERVLYDQDLPAPAQARDRTRRMWSQVVSGTRATVSHISQKSLTLPSQKFVQEHVSQCMRDHGASLRVLAIKPELALYDHVYEVPGFKDFLQRDTKGQQAAQIRFQLR